MAAPPEGARPTPWPVRVRAVAASVSGATALRVSCCPGAPRRR